MTSVAAREGSDTPSAKTRQNSISVSLTLTRKEGFAGGYSPPNTALTSAQVFTYRYSLTVRQNGRLHPLFDALFIIKENQTRRIDVSGAPEISIAQTNRPLFLLQPSFMTWSSQVTTPLA